MDKLLLSFCLLLPTHLAQATTARVCGPCLALMWRGHPGLARRFERAVHGRLLF